MPYAITTTGYRAVGLEFTDQDLEPGETLVDSLSEDFLKTLADQATLRDSVLFLDALTRRANDQITAIQGRIDTLTDIVELDEPTAEESAELPTRSSQLKEWKKYRIALGRVTAQAEWPVSPIWPAVPETFVTEGMRSAATEA